MSNFTVVLENRQLFLQCFQSDLFLAISLVIYKNHARL
jgi:hypothetical protein